jgi:hypothetical protein
VRPDDIPTNPNQTYAQSGWKGIGDWLGTGVIASRNIVYRPFEEARSFVHSLELKCVDEWYKFCRGQMPEKGSLPDDIPSKPSRSYSKNGWKGVGDWLGTGTIASRFRVYLPFEEARAFVHSIGLKNQDEWRRFCKGQLSGKGKKPAYVPSTPSRTYAKMGWKGMADWLGK